MQRPVTIVCKICSRPASKPYRWIVRGKIVEGCISNFHSGHLIPGSPSEAWHNRQSAKDHRRRTKFDFNPETGYWSK